MSSLAVVETETARGWSGGRRLIGAIAQIEGSESDPPTVSLPSIRAMVLWSGRGGWSGTEVLISLLQQQKAVLLDADAGVV